MTSSHNRSDNENPAAATRGASSRWRVLFLIVIVVALLVTMSALPIDRGVELMKSRIADMGFWGPLVFGVVYVIAALLFVPGAALTAAAGAIFGAVWGTVTVSAASTTAASLAFLIGRYLARSRVEDFARHNPKFAAIDRAVGEGGARIIALLRLSPAMPFSIGNYLFGLTSVSFGSYVLTSWIFMLPGTFLYVYLGHVAAAGVEAAAGGGGRSPGQWALLIVGLIATIAVTTYITRLLKKQLQQSSTGDTAKDNAALASAADNASPDASATVAKPPSTARTVALGAGALLMVVIAACAQMNKQSLRGLFGPPPVKLEERYEEKADGPQVNHAAFDALLRSHVDADGWVDYAGLADDAAPLDQYIASLASVKFDALGRNEKLALLINGYNAFTLRLILDHRPIESIRDIPAAQRWDAVRWNIGGSVWSLNQIEHEQVRPNFREPRVHFALVCAAIGCPKLRNEAYAADRLEEQLDDQARYVHTHDRWFVLDSSGDAVKLTKLYQWYGSDFAQVAGSELEFAARYVEPLQRLLTQDTPPKIEWLPYDWTLNDQRNRPQ